MEDYKKRLLEEFSDLNKKVEKLRAFVVSDKYKELPQEEKDDLAEQLGSMTMYLIVLSRRVLRLPAPEAIIEVD